MELGNIGGDGVKQVPLLGLKEIDPSTNLDNFKGDIPRVPLSGLKRSQQDIITTPGAVPMSYERILGEEGYHPEFTRNTIEEQLAANQTAGGQFLNFLNQAVVGQVVGGTLEGFGYLMDLRGPAMLVDDGEKSFGELLVGLGKALRTEVEEVSPIFTRPSDPSFNIGNFAWWMKNGPSIASTFSLMLPAAGAVKGIGMAGKLLGLSQKLGIGLKTTLSVLGQATLSRHMENMMEASGVYEEVYKTSIDKGMSSEDASKKASMAASSTYKADWAMLGMDIAQYALLQGKIYKPNGELSPKFAKMLGRSTEEIALPELKRYASGIAGEAFEEGWQWIASEESKYTAEKTFDPSVKGTFGDRMSGYLRSGDLWTNAFFGGLGGGVFTAAGGITQNLLGDGDPQVNEVKSWGVDFKASYEKMKNGVSMGDEFMVKEAQQELKNGIGVRLASKGMLDSGIEMYEKIAKGELTPDEFEKLGIDPASVQDVKGSDIEQSKQDIKAAGMRYIDYLKRVLDVKDPLSKVANKLYESRTSDLKGIDQLSHARQYAALLAKTDLKLNDLNKHNTKLSNEVRAAELKIVNIGNLSKTGSTIILNKAFINGYENQKKQIEDVVKNKTNLDLKKQREDALKGVSKPNKIKEINDKYNALEAMRSSIDDNIARDIQTRLTVLDGRIAQHKQTLKKLEAVYTKEEKEIDDAVNFPQSNLDDYYKIKAVADRVEGDMISYQKALDRYKKGKISSDEQRDEYNKDYEDKNKDIKDLTPEEGDIINWVDESGLDHIGVISSIDKDDLTKANVQEIDENWQDIGEQVPKNLSDLELYEKAGDIELDKTQLESISDKDKTPEQIHREELEDSGANKALSDLANSLCYVNMDMSNLTTFLNIRDQKLNAYASDPNNKFVGAVATYSIDWNNDFWIMRSALKDSLQKGKDVDKLLNVKPENIENFSVSLVDKIPIKISIKSGEDIFDRELFVHDSDFWNVRMPSTIPDMDPEVFVLEQRQECRAARHEVLSQLLKGNIVTTAGLSKLNGFFNKVATNGNVHERLGVDSGTLTVYIGVPTSEGGVQLQSSPTDIRRIFRPSKGAAYIITNKTCNSNPVLLKLNPQRLSVEHIDLYWDAMRLAYSTSGFKAHMKETEIDGKGGLTAKEVMNLLALNGSRATNPKHVNNKGMEDYRKNKALFINHEKDSQGRVKTMLYFGDKTIDLFETNPGIADQNQKYFREWALANKNYRIPLEDKSMGLNLNSPFKRTFKIGSIENRPDEKGQYKPYSTVLIDSGVLMTNVDRVKDTDGKYIESITHAPVIDINFKSLDVKEPTREVEPEIKPRVTSPPPSTIKSGDNIGEKTQVGTLKQLDVNSVISYTDANGETNFATITVGSGKKVLSLQPGFEEMVNNRKEITLVASNQEVLTKLFEELLSTSKEINFRSAVKKSIVSEVGPEPKITKESINKRAIEYGIIDREDGEILEYVLNFDISVKRGDENYTKIVNILPEGKWQQLVDDAYNLKHNIKPKEVVVQKPGVGPKFLSDIQGIGKEVYNVKEGTKLISTTELDWVKEKLGPQKVVMTDKLIEISGKLGKLHFGAFRVDAIFIYNAAPGEVLYHESFHRVSLGYLNDFERRRVYSETRRRYGLEMATNAQIEEFLADKFMEYKIDMLDGVVPDKRSFIDYIRDLYDFIKSIFTGESRLRSYDIDKLFESIERGKFRYVKISNENLKALEGKTIGYEIGGMDIPTVSGIKEVNDIATSLATVLVKENHVESINDIGRVGSGFYKPLFEYIDHEPVTGKIFTDGRNDKGGLLQQFKSVERNLQLELSKPGIDAKLQDEYSIQLKQTQHLIDLYNSILDPRYLPIFVDKIDSALRLYNISKKEVDAEDNNQENLNEHNSVDTVFNNVNKASYELNIKDTVSASIKFLIHTLPKSDKINPTTFTIDHVDFNETWSDLFFDLHNTDNIDEILHILDGKSNVYPYKILAERLRAGDDLLRTQFKVAMNKQKNLYINFLFSYNENGIPIFKKSEADVFNAGKMETQSWNETLYLSNLVNKTGKPELDRANINVIIKEYGKFKDDFSVTYEKLFKNLTNAEIDSTITKLIPILNKIGISVDRATIDNVITKSSLANKITKSIALNRFLLVDFDHVLSRLAVEVGTKKTPIRKIYSDEHTVRELAESMYEVHPDMLNDMHLGPGGNRYFTYSQNTYLSDTIRKFNKDSNSVLDKLSKIYNKHSSFLSQMLDENIRRNVKMLTFSAFIQEEIGDSGRDYLSLNRMEDYLFKLYALERNLVPFPTMGDKRTHNLLEGVTPIDFDLEWVEGKPVFPKSVIDLFYDYARDEEERIIEAKNIIKSYNEEKDPVLKEEKLKNMYINYHYIKRGDEIDTKFANATKHLLFPSFDTVKDFNFEKDARGIIPAVLQDRLNDELIFAEERGVLLGDYKETGRFVPSGNLKIDYNLVTKHMEDHGTEQKALENIIARFLIKNVQGGIEFSKLFAGDPAFKKMNQDKGTVDDNYTKYLSGALSTGDVTNNESSKYSVLGETYSVATMYTQEVNLSRLYQQNTYDTIFDSQLAEYIKDFSKKEGFESLSAKGKTEQIRILKESFGINLKEMLSGYNVIDSTDGQAWISPDMYRSLSIRVGEWSPTKETAFKLLQSDRELTEDEYVQSLNVVLQPLKILGYGLMGDGNLEVPLINKMSAATLFRQMGKFGHDKNVRIELMNMLDRMEAKGKYLGLKPINMVKMNTASKSAGKVGFNFYSDEKLEEVSDFINIPVFEEPYALTRKQLTTDPHDVEDIRVSTQPLKIAMGNLRMDEAIYDNPLGGITKITGSDLVNTILKSTRAMSNKGVDRLIEKLGIKNGKVDKEKLVALLKRNNIKSGVADLIADSLRMDGSEMYLEIDAFPNRKHVISGIISAFARETVDVRLPGNQFIQFSNLGVRVNKSDELKFTTVEKEGINTMECYVSLNLFKDIIPNFKKLSFEEKRAFVLANKDTIMGYRIPAQGQGSVWILTVKDVYQETIGDVITLPAAFTKLTGSDFDIDKVYAVRYNYTNYKGRPRKVAFQDTVQKAWDNDYALRYDWVYGAFNKLDKIKNNDFGPVGGKIETEDLLKGIRSALNIDMTDKDGKENSLSKLLSNIYNDAFFEEEYNKLKDKVGIIEDKKKTFFDKYQNETDPFKFNSVEAIENLLMDGYASVLTNKAHIRETVTPLGSYDRMLNDLAAEIHRYDETKYKSKDLVLYTPSKQSNFKFEYTGGKDGMAPFALNNVHHVLSQIAGLKMMVFSGGMLNEDIDGHIDLSKIDGKDNYNISSWLSALIDIHIDQAKDPRFMWLNINPTTYDIVGLLIRGGFGIDTFKLISQPIIKEYSKLVLDSQRDGKITRFSDPREVEPFLTEEWTKKLGDVTRTAFDERSLIDGEEMMKNIEDQKDKVNDPIFISKQLAYLKIFTNLLKTGKRLNALVQSSQLDTKQFENSVTSLIDFRERIDEVVNSGDFINADKMFASEVDGGVSFLGPYYDNFLKFTLNTMSDLTIYSTPVFKMLLEEIRRMTATKFTGDKRLREVLSDELMGAIYAKFFNDPDNIGLNAKKVGEIFTNVMSILDTIRSDKKYADLAENNPLIKILIKSPLEEYLKEDLRFDTYLAIPNKNLADKFSSDALMYGWRDLFMNDDPKVKNLARLLFYYSYITSGFRSRMFSFFNYLPPSVMKEFEGIDPKDPTKKKVFSFNEFIKEQRDLLADTDNLPMFGHLVDEVIKNNWSNSRIVPRVIRRNRSNELKDEKTAKLLAFTTNRWNNKIGTNADGQPIYTKYLTTFIPGEGVYLSKYIGVITENINGKDQLRPVYKVIPKLSFEKGGVVMKEYLFDESVVPSNNVKFIPDGDEMKVLTKDERYKNFDSVDDYDAVGKKRTSTVDLLTGTLVEEETPTVLALYSAEFVIDEGELDDYPFLPDEERTIFSTSNKEIRDLVEKLSITDWSDVTKDQWIQLRDKYLHCK